MSKQNPKRPPNHSGSTGPEHIELNDECSSRLEGLKEDNPLVYNEVMRQIRNMGKTCSLEVLNLRIQNAELTMGMAEAKEKQMDAERRVLEVTKEMQKAVGYMNEVNAILRAASSVCQIDFKLVEGYKNTTPLFDINKDAVHKTALILLCQHAVADKHAESNMELVYNRLQSLLSGANTISQSELVLQIALECLLQAIIKVHQDGAPSKATTLLELVDTSRPSFIGNSSKPDLSFVAPSGGLVSFQSIKRVVEIKIGNALRVAAKVQVLQRAVDLRNLKGDIEGYRFEGAVADDVGIELVQCNLTSSEQADPKILSVNIARYDCWSHLCRAVISLASEHSFVQCQDSGDCSGRASAGTAAKHTIQSSMYGKAAVVLEIDGAGAPTIVKRYQEPQRGKYFAEAQNLAKVKDAFAKANIPFLNFTANDGDCSLTFHLVGYAAAINTAGEAEIALLQLKRQLDAAHAAGLIHGDISPRNIVMSVDRAAMDKYHELLCSTVGRAVVEEWKDGEIPSAAALIRLVARVRAAVTEVASEPTASYQLIDWGEAETLQSDKTLQKAVTILCSYPLPETATPQDRKDRDLYALNCSLIVMYAQGRRLPSDCRWDKHNPVDFKNGVTVFNASDYIALREALLVDISGVSQVAEEYPAFFRRLAAGCLELHPAVSTGQ